MPVTVDTKEEKVALRDLYFKVRGLVASGMMQRDILTVFVQGKLGSMNVEFNSISNF